MTEIGSAPISISFIYELEDHLEALRVFYRKGVLSKLYKVVVVLMFSFAVYCIASEGLRLWTAIFFPLLTVAAGFVMLPLTGWLMKFVLRRNPKLREELREEYHLTFSRENIHFKTASVDSTVQWTNYERVIESPKLFLLMYNKWLYTHIPKRCFNSSEEVDAFRGLVSQTIAR